MPQVTQALYNELRQAGFSDAEIQAYAAEQAASQQPSPWGMAGNIGGGIAAQQAGKYVGGQLVGEGAASGIGANAASMGMGPMTGIAIGTYLAGNEAKNLVTNKAKDWGKASTADKAGRVQLAITTGGLSELGRAFGLGKHKSTKEIEQERANKLLEKNPTGFRDYYTQTMQGLDAYKQANPGWNPGDAISSSPADFVGVDDSGRWVNNKFATSRNEADLTGKDIWGQHAFFERYGDDWLGKFSEAEREEIANDALAAKAVNEGKGQINVDWNKVDSYRKQKGDQAGSLAQAAQTMARKPEINNMQGAPGRIPDGTSDIALEQLPMVQLQAPAPDKGQMVNAALEAYNNRVQTQPANPFENTFSLSNYYNNRKKPPFTY